MGRTPLYETIVFERWRIFDYLLSLELILFTKANVAALVCIILLAQVMQVGAMQSVLRSCRLDEVNDVDSNDWSLLH